MICCFFKSICCWFQRLMKRTEQCAGILSPSSPSPSPGLPCRFSSFFQVPSRSLCSVCYVVVQFVMLCLFSSSIDCRFSGQVLYVLGLLHAPGARQRSSVPHREQLKGSFTLNKSEPESDVTFSGDPIYLFTMSVWQWSKIFFALINSLYGDLNWFGTDLCDIIIHDHTVLQNTMAHWTFS